MIATGIFPPDIGGPATYVPKIAEALVDRGHEVEVITASDQMDHPDHLFPFGVTRVQRSGSKMLRRVRTVWSIARVARRMDVLLVNGLALEATLANAVARKPIVLKVVGDLSWELASLRGKTESLFEDFQSEDHDFEVRWIRRLQGWWTRRASRVIANSNYMASWAKSWGAPSKKTAVVYNSADILEQVTPAKLSLSTSLTISSVTRLVSWKRIDELIRAVSNVDDAGLVIVGDGPEEDALKRLAVELGVAKRVHFAGRKSRSEALSIVAGSDLFVLNSTWESFAHGVLEAMALGVPVIATATGGTLEQIEDCRNGLLVSPEHRCLTHAISMAAADPELRKRLGQNGIDTVRTKFSFESMVDNTEVILLEAASMRD